MNPTDSIEKHFTRLKPEQKRALHKLRIKTIGDLLYHFPARYESAGPTGTIAGVAPGAEVTLYGTIRKPDVRKTWKSRRPIAEAYLEDASGKIKLMWFSQPYIAKTLHDGMVVKIRGKVTGTAEKPYVANPEIDKTPLNPEEMHDSLFLWKSDVHKEEEPLHPVYPESQGVSSLWLFHALKKVFETHVHETIEDPIPHEILDRYNLPKLSTAFVWLHHPRNRADADVARKRFAFEEVFVLQLAMQKRRAETVREKALPINVDRGTLSDFVASFPFPPPGAQTRA
ncbi:MAG TPA: OB-fold nucleic acid binding domain-containing protein, partial [Candidatus Paceibacterota bacterium]|nr:OB-fold nucleic acid binding domain-containing protein [Candidatus Paceibacterota bacterium]